MEQPCPHCGGKLSKWKVPDEATWSESFLYVCFDDACPYYQRGWTWMMEQFNQKASYRFAISPRTRNATMIPVWSAQATREQIVNDTEEGEQ